MTGSLGHAHPMDDTTSSDEHGTDSRGGIPGPDDPRTALAGAVGVLREVMGAVTPDQWESPTPCADMTVAELLEHVVMVMRRIALAGRAVPVAQWPSDAADVAPGGWLDAATAAAHDIQAAWTDDSFGDERELPWGVFPGPAVLGVYTNELVVHSWDLATATGQRPVWDEPVLVVAWSAITAQLPTADRTPMWEATKAMLPPGYEWQDPFANAVEVPEDAALIDRLVAWNGRTP